MNLFTDTIEESIDYLSEFRENHSGPFFVCYEVFAIKAFYDRTRNSWLFATKKKANAFHSFWSERRSFGQLFMDEIADEPDFLTHLRTNTDYYFLVPLRRRNRVLLSREEEEAIAPGVWLAGAVIHGEAGKELPVLFDLSDDRAIFKGPWKFLPTIEPEEYDPEDYPGSVGLAYCNLRAQNCPETSEPETPRLLRLVRFLLPRYLPMRDLRSNASDIYARYGELWRDRSPKINLFRRHYDDYIRPFDLGIDELHNLYHRRYVEGEYVNTTPLRHAILKKIKDFQRRKNWETITKNNIYSIVFRNFTTKLYKIPYSAKVDERPSPQ